MNPTYNLKQMSRMSNLMPTTYNLKQMLEAIVAVHTNTPVGQFFLTNPNFAVSGIGPYIGDDLTDVQMLVDAVKSAYHEHFVGTADEPVYTMHQMTKLFKRSAQTINRWARDGRIPAYRTPDGRLTGLFPASDVDVVMEGGVL